MSEIRTTNKSGVSRFIENAVVYGMKQVVCSPGSRNAPLIIALDEHPEIETFVVHDERSAAFFALGLSLASGLPVGVCCTSGSAMLNYYPAVAEAYYQCVPLIVLSADRPEEWIDQGDGQTIVQKGVYENHIRFEATINEFCHSENDESEIDLIVQNGFAQASGAWKGPIHFNFPLSEPLYEISLRSIEPIEKVIIEKENHSIDFSEYTKKWSRFKKKMILCGQSAKNVSLLNELVQISDDTSVVVLVESPSNLVHRNFIQCIDRTLAAISESELNDFEPDLLVTIGGAVISKKIKQLLRKANIKEHWKIGFEFPEMNTYRHLSNVVKCSPLTLFQKLNSEKEYVIDSNFGSKWKQKDYQFESAIGEFISTVPYSDLSVFELIMDYIPENSNLHLANSSVVRYAQLFSPISSLSYYSNRGTSGIDGSSSTAFGVSINSPNKYNVLITGDISFFYDSNAFWNNYLGKNLRIILINNGGGGIFKIIPGPKSTGKLEKYFNTENAFDSKGICDTFNIEYFKANNLMEIDSQMEAFYEDNSERPKLMEIDTINCNNEKVLSDFFNLGTKFYK